MSKLDETDDDDETFKQMQKVAEKTIETLKNDTSEETMIALAKLVDDKMRDMLIRHGYLKPPTMH